LSVVDARLPRVVTLRVAVTVKLVDALALPVSVAVIVCAPLPEAGTVNVADHEPSAATVGLAGLIVRALPPKVTLTVLVAT
jgi:hypothetical protein